MSRQIHFNLQEKENLSDDDNWIVFCYMKTSIFVHVILKYF